MEIKISMIQIVEFPLDEMWSFYEMLHFHKIWYFHEMWLLIYTHEKSYCLHGYIGQLLYNAHIMMCNKDMKPWQPWSS